MDGSESDDNGDIPLSKLEVGGNNKATENSNSSSLHYHRVQDIANDDFIFNNPLWKAIHAVLSTEESLKEESFDYLQNLLETTIERCDEKDFEIVSLGLEYRRHICGFRNQQVLQRISDGDDEYIKNMSALLKRRMPSFQEKFEIGDTCDIMRCVNIPRHWFLIFVTVQLIQQGAYLSVLMVLNVLNVQKGGNDDAVFEANIALAVIFASLTLSMTAFKNVVQILSVAQVSGYIMTACTAQKERSLKQTLSVNRLQHFIMYTIEIVNLCSLLFASYLLLTIGGDAVDIITNCTGLFLISELGSLLSSTWKLKLKNVVTVDSNSEEESIVKTYKIRHISIGLSVAMMITVICERIL